MEVHLPCPPLAEWLPVRLAGRTVGACVSRQTPRRLRPTLGTWPTLTQVGEPGGAGADPDHVAPEACDALLFGTSLERPSIPEAALASLRPGTWIIELAVPRRRIVRSLLGLDARPLARAEAAQARVLSWLARGCHGLEQWESVEPSGVVVTWARVR